MSEEKVIEYNLTRFDLKSGDESLSAKRKYIAGLDGVTKAFTSEVTIWIQAYNNFEKTKRCIESVLEYTKDIDFDLILVDNLAGDETYEYFKAVDYEKKTVIHFNENTGSAYPFTVVPIDMISKYFVLLNNDLIVTKNWLSNLLKVMKSDESIGIVNPVSSNASNFQGVEFKYNSYEEMQEIAAKINVSDSSKWEERLRVVTLGTLIKKECLMAMGWPLFDIGFAHNFMDDDMSFRARRAGYKLMVTRDTWICHDHPFARDNEEEFAAVLTRDLEKFKGKYFGVNPWDDATNSLIAVPNLLNQVEVTDKKNVNILGIDVRCGMPILDIKNLIPKDSVVETSAYFQDAKFYTDLCTVCNGTAICGKENEIKFSYEKNSFDYIVIGEPINLYDNPIQMVVDAYQLLSEKGQLIISLKNTRNVVSILTSLGYALKADMGICQDISLDDFGNILNNMGIRIRSIAVQGFEGMSESVHNAMKQILAQSGNQNSDMGELEARLMADKFFIIIQKQ